MTATREKRGGKGVLIAGAALAALLLLGGSGWGLSSGWGRKGGGSGGKATRVRIRIDAAGITADGVPSSIEETVDIARTVGTADVLATGAARQGTVDDLLAALRDAGVTVFRVGAHRA